MKNLKVGDICVTQNSAGGLINDGLLVEIIDLASTERRASMPYLIRRLDGQRIPATQDQPGSTPHFFADSIAWAPEHKLRRLDPDCVFGRNVTADSEQTTIESIERIEP